MHYPILVVSRNILLLLALHLFCTSILLPATTHAADTPTVLYVNKNATGANNGTSWQNAYTDLQNALAAAQAGTQIWVARGIYYPTNVSSDRTASFILKSGVALYGGFAGSETQLHERDWLANPTILSGDIDRNDTHTNGIVIDTSGLLGSNSYHVVTDDAIDESAILDGFIITAGWANGVNNERLGGGLYIFNSSPTITNVRFSGNSATAEGGAIFSYANKLTITQSTFAGNSAQMGGALYKKGGLDNSTLTIINTTFSGNYALHAGGAIVLEQSLNPLSPTTSSIINTTFSGNSAQSGSVIFAFNNTFSINNSILWGNSAPALTGVTEGIITYSLVQGCDPSGTWNTATCGTNGGGNLANVDPQFVNPISYTDAPTTTGDLRLQPNSPAIDKGNNALNDTTEDLEGKPRIMGPTIDLGAYEFAYQLQKGIIGSGQINHSPIGDWHLPNTTVTLTATANPGWSFASWGGDLSGSSSPITLVMNNNKVITATFTNDPPTANAGADQTVRVGALVTLDGSASFDADPSQTLSYTWTQTAGTPVTLTGANTAQPTFTAPSEATTLTFSLIVTDSLGKASTADSVTVTVMQHRLFLPATLR